MKIEKITKRLKCDIGGCKNLASFAVVHERGKPYNNLNLCDDCIKKLYAVIGTQLVPESVPSKFSKKKTEKRG